MRKTLYGLFFFFIFSFISLRADERVHPKILEDQANLETGPPISVDEAHRTLSLGVTRLSNRIDRFFGSKRGQDQENGSQVRLTYISSKVEAEEVEHEGLIKFRLKLPYLEELLKISFKKEAKDPKTEEKKENQNQSVSEKNEPPTMAEQVLDAILEEPSRWSIHVNTGVKVEIPPQFFTNLRFRRFTSFGKWEFRASQEFFWFSRDGFGETSTIDFDRPINKDLLFRVRNQATWVDKTDTFSTEHGPTLFWQLSSRRGISFRTVALGTSKPSFHINNYQASINYRQLLHDRWFYTELGPTLDFPQDQNWKSRLSAFVKFEVLIGSY